MGANPQHPPLPRKPPRRCQCAAPYDYSPDCSADSYCINECRERGKCVDGVCVCDIGFWYDCLYCHPGTPSISCCGDDTIPFQEWIFVTVMSCYGKRSR